MYPTALNGVGPTNSYEQLENDPKYKLPSYAEVEAMGSLGPPADGEGAPPPYVDPLANEELGDDASNSQVDTALTRSTEDVSICLIAQEVHPSETP